MSIRKLGLGLVGPDQGDDLRSRGEEPVDDGPADPARSPGHKDLGVFAGRGGIIPCHAEAGGGRGRMSVGGASDDDGRESRYSRGGDRY